MILGSTARSCYTSRMMTNEHSSLPPRGPRGACAQVAIATIICALRALQERGEAIHCGHCGEHSHEVGLLDSHEIDALIESLNFSRTLLVDVPADLKAADDVEALLDWIWEQSPDGEEAVASVERQAALVRACLRSMP